MTEDLKRVSGLLGNLGLIEFISVLSGNKPGMRTTCRESIHGELSDIANQFGMSFAVSDYQLAGGNRSGGISHTSGRVRPMEGKENRERFVYFGTDALAVRLLKVFDVTDNRRFGRLLGFPECCIDFFCEHFSSESAYDLVPLVLPPRHGYFLPSINYACRHMGYRLISHFPCCWDCEPSAALAEKNFAALARLAPELAEKTTYWLTADVFYSLRVIAAVKSQGLGGRISLKNDCLVSGEVSPDVLEINGSLAQVFRGEEVLCTVDEFCLLPFQSQGATDSFKKKE
jgi:hypothetical protein